MLEKMLKTGGALELHRYRQLLCEPDEKASDELLILMGKLGKSRDDVVADGKLLGRIKELRAAYSYGQKLAETARAANVKVEQFDAETKRLEAQRRGEREAVAREADKLAKRRENAIAAANELADLKRHNPELLADETDLNADEI